ncbi:MAG: LamG-like jellyroll fold domain-containing protein [Phycisphaeraceae bacterium]
MLYPTWMHVSPHWRLLTILLLVALVMMCGKAKADDVATWPLPGLLDADEGTIEMWVRLDFEPLAPHDGYHSHANPLRMSWADPSYPDDQSTWTLFSKHAGYRTSSGMQAGLRFAMRAGGESLFRPLYVNFEQDAERGQWHHLAVAWSRRAGEVVGYLNGRRSAARSITSDSTLMIFPDAMLALGEGRIAIDELRLSSVARPHGQLGHDGALEPDSATLLLMRFDELPSNDTSELTLAPDWAATSAGRKTRPLPDHVRVTEGRFGQALQLHSDNQ